MNRIATVLAILTSCSLAQQDPFGDGRGPGNPVERDPFGDSGPPKDRGSFVPPSNIRVLLQSIEISHTDLTTMMADASSGAVLHTRAMKLVEKQSAMIVDSSVFTFQSGHRTLSESIREFVFPMGFSENEIPNRIPEMAASDRASRRISWWIWSSKNARKLAMQCWWTMNVGNFHQLEAHIGDGARTLELWGAVENSTLTGMNFIKSHRTDQGDDSIRMPQFEKRRANLSLSLSPGVWQLAAVLDPLPRPPAPALATKVLLFIRCEVPGTPAK